MTRELLRLRGLWSLVGRLGVGGVLIWLAVWEPSRVALTILLALLLVGVELLQLTSSGVTEHEMERRLRGR